MSDTEETTARALGQSPADPGRRFRLQSQREELLREGQHLDDAPLLEDPAAAAGSAPKDRPWWARISLSGGEWAIAALALYGVALVLVLTIDGADVLSRGMMAVIAGFPLLVVTAVLGWVDRLAPLRARYKVLAVVWGVGIAGGASLLVNSGLQRDILLYTGDPAGTDWWTAVVVAPFAEEFFKGLGVVVILLLGRHRLCSVLSGLALGGLVGAGFAFIENIEYFSAAASQGSTVLGMTVFARGVLSPFIHPMATSLTGAAVASALLVRAGGWGWAWRLVAGYGAAVGIHALWNQLASGELWLATYVIIEVPLFAAWLVILVIWSSRQVRTISAGLEPYVETRWISPAELRMVTTPFGRKYSQRWARGIGKPAPKLVRRFRRRLGYLGLDQVLMSNHGLSDERLEADREYLRDVETLRVEFRFLQRKQAADKKAGL